MLPSMKNICQIYIYFLKQTIFYNCLYLKKLQYGYKLCIIDIFKVVCFLFMVVRSEE